MLTGVILHHYAKVKVAVKTYPDTLVCRKERTMGDLKKTVKSLEQRGHVVRVFPTGKEAADYLVGEIRNTEVGIGGCMTAEQIGLYEKLSEKNVVYWHWRSQDPDIRKKENEAPVFITGCNAISEDGEILNIDGSGNRLAGQVFGNKKVYFISGINKICHDFDSALFRARNVASVTNAARFDIKTPCKLDGQCHNCLSKDRICNALLVIWGPMIGMETEVILIEEDLGY